MVSITWLSRIYTEMDSSLITTTRSRSLRAVIIVNAGKVNPSNLQLDASVSDDMIQDRIEGFFMERMADLKRDREVQGDEGWSEGYKPQKIVDAMTIRFVSMPEYLKAFDWTGEFTDEEVAPWLEDIGKAGN